MGNYGEYRPLDVLAFLLFSTFIVFSIYYSYISLLVKRDYTIFTTEEEVEAALEFDLSRALTNLYQ